MTQALALGERDRVLEIGTGSGYQSAVLAHLCRRVCTIERYRTLLAQAETRFETLKLHNITTRLGDGGKGWPELAPFARIIVTAAAPTMPSALADQLDEDGGIMVVPVGQPGAQTLIRVRRDDAGFHEERLLDVRFVPLVDGMPQGR
jgi:protein-L-isoaspartate(D-aspartate) O-methyltransferase